MKVCRSEKQQLPQQRSLNREGAKVSCSGLLIGSEAETGGAGNARAAG